MKPAGGGYSLCQVFVPTFREEPLGTKQHCDPRTSRASRQTSTVASGSSDASASARGAGFCWDGHASAPDPSAGAPIVRQRRSILASCSAHRSHQVACARRRTASLLHASLSFRYTQPFGQCKFTTTCLFSTALYSASDAPRARERRAWL